MYRHLGRVLFLVMVLSLCAYAGEDDFGSSVTALWDLLRGPVFGVLVLASSVICAIKILNGQFGYILVWLIGTLFLSAVFNTIEGGTGNSGVAFVIPAMNLDTVNELPPSIRASIASMGSFVDIGLARASGWLTLMCRWHLPAAIAGFGAILAWRKFHRGDYLAPVEWLLTCGAIMIFGTTPMCTLTMASTSKPGGMWVDDEGKATEVHGYAMPLLPAIVLSTGVRFAEAIATTKPADAQFAAPPSLKQPKLDSNADAIQRAMDSARLPDALVGCVRGYTANTWMVVAHRFDINTASGQSGKSETSGLWSANAKRDFIKNGVSPFGEWFIGKDGSGSKYSGLSYDWGLFNEETDIPQGDDVGLNDNKISTARGGPLNYESLANRKLTTPTDGQSGSFFQHDPIKKLYKGDDTVKYKAARDNLNGINDRIVKELKAETTGNAGVWYGWWWGDFNSEAMKYWTGDRHLEGQTIDLLYLAEDSYGSLGRLAQKQIEANGLFESREQQDRPWGWWGWWWYWGWDDWDYWYGWWYGYDIEKCTNEQKAEIYIRYIWSQWWAARYWAESQMPFNNAPYRAIADIGYFPLVVNSMPVGAGGTINVTVRYRVIGTDDNGHDEQYERVVTERLQRFVTQRYQSQMDKYNQMRIAYTGAKAVTEEKNRQGAKDGGASFVPSDPPPPPWRPVPWTVNVSFETVPFAQDVLQKLITYYTSTISNHCASVFAGSDWSDPDAFGCLVFNSTNNHASDHGDDGGASTWYDDIYEEIDWEKYYGEEEGGGANMVPRIEKYIGDGSQKNGSSSPSEQRLRLRLKAQLEAGGTNLIAASAISESDAKKLAILVSVPQVAQQLGWKTTGMTTVLAKAEKEVNNVDGGLPATMPKFELKNQETGESLSVWDIGEVIQAVIYWVLSAIVWIGLVIVWALARLAALIVPIGGPYAMSLTLMFAMICYPAFMLFSLVRWEVMLDWIRCVFWVCLWVVPMCIGFSILHDYWSPDQNMTLAILDVRVLVAQIGAVFVILASPMIAQVFVAPSFGAFTRVGESIWSITQKLTFMSFGFGMAVVGGVAGAAGGGGSSPSGPPKPPGGSADVGPGGGGTADVSGGSPSGPPAPPPSSSTTSSSAPPASRRGFGGGGGTPSDGPPASGGADIPGGSSGNGSGAAPGGGGGPGGGRAEGMKRGWDKGLSFANKVAQATDIFGMGHSDGVAQWGTAADRSIDRRARKEEDEAKGQ